MDAAPCIPGELTALTDTLWRLTAPNAGPMTGAGTNTYFYGSSAAVVVIDPGPADAGHIDAIVSLAPGPITAIAVTHTHRDHSPGATPLATRVGAPLLGMSAPRTPENDHGFQPTRVLADKEAITVDSARPLTAIHTPGHASNHLCYLTADGVLVTGDHIMQGATVVILPPDGDMQAYLDALERLKTFELAAIAPGHGTLIESPYEEIDRVLVHRRARDAKVANAVAAHGPLSIDDLLPVVYDDVPEFLYPLARRSLEAHLIRLTNAGAISKSSQRWYSNPVQERQES